MRILAIDYGKKRSGFALSDPTGHFAQPLSVVEAPDTKSLIQEVLELVHKWNVTKVVVGLPLSLDGSEGKAARETLQLVRCLREKLSLPVETWDERLSTLRAESALRESSLSRAKRKRKVDKVAAQMILQGYLDRAGRERH